MMQVGIFNPVGGSSRKELDIGSVLLTTNTKTPRQMGYVGEWHLIEDGVTFISAETEAGAVMGINNPLVPVPHHGHTAVFIGDPLEPHEHEYDQYTRDGGAPGLGGLGSGKKKTTKVSAGRPSGKVTVNPNGISNATLDVRGRHMKVFAWWRVG
ncbi:hypothetical protein SNE98_003283 [Vibrio cholerae]|nr:hypothetical protein [Vibrio cholerae]ELY5216272.1 hypothetical protein [Vibrio cholerae]